MTLRLSVALSFVAMNAKHEAGEMTEVLRLAQRVIDLAEGDATKGNLLFGSPLALVIALRGIARCCLGIAGWKDDLPQATSMAKAFDPSTFATVMWHNIAAIAYGALLPDAATLRNTAETLAMEEQSGDDLILDLARATRGITLIHDNGPERKAGLDLLAKIREKALDGRFALTALPVTDIHIARERARLGDFDGAIVAQRVIDGLFATGGSVWDAQATSVLVESLLQRAGDEDIEDARGAIDRLAAMATDPGFVLNEIWLLRLRALLARAHGDETAYRDYRDRYRAMATSLGFEGHIEWAEAMP